MVSTLPSLEFKDVIGIVCMGIDTIVLNKFDNYHLSIVSHYGLI